ncbi:MAG TPA: hypothetical protein VNK48_14550 [Xanthobacteraceae bacterium]|nr:hypothetical protein [Xanthobacteraceae bacterium]
MTYTDRGLRELFAGLGAALDALELERQRTGLIEEIADRESRLRALNTIESGVALAMEVIAAWQREREAAEKASEGAGT